MALPRVYICNVKFPTAGLNLLRGKVETIISPFTDDDSESLSEIKNGIQGANGIIWCTKHKLTESILHLAGPQLKVVSTLASGVDHIEINALKKRGIKLGNTPHVLNSAVADIAVGLLIGAARRFKEGVEELNTGNWKYGVQWMIGQDIEGSTVGVIGLGGIGQSIVKRLKGFGVEKFLYTGRSDKPEAIELGAVLVSLDKLLSESDFIILACPLTDKTRNMINETTIKQMKRTATLINISRGEVVDQEALYKALKEKRIWAAGLDVVTPEPIAKDHPLLSLPNCFIIPHLGSATIKTRNDMAVIAAENILCGLKDEPFKFQIV